jgi:uncharacterized repeat protein (TIGR01451 family)
MINYYDSVLEYMVHFQNTTGNMVENVVVTDTIDDNLDWTTLSPKYTSAPCKITVDQSGSRKVATFSFQHINLPAQPLNDLGSDGMLTYTIKMRHGLAVGAQFKNRASIYFDYLAPMQTNTTLNTLANTAVNSVASVSGPENKFTLYPNPANNQFNIVINSENTGKANLVVTDVSGRNVLVRTIDVMQGNQNFSVDASQYVPGVYFISLNGAGLSGTQKLVILK